MPKTAHAERAAPSLAHVTPARHELAEIVLDLHDAERKASAARAPVERLEAEIALEAAARARLAALDADYTARMAEWADSGIGAAPDPNLKARQEALGALHAATLKAGAARDALARLRDDIAAADAQVGDARARIKPAVAAVLREEGGWLVAEYWRRYAELEEVRRDLAALDQILLSDFPIIHAATGRTIVHWISPDKLSAAAAQRAIADACAGLAGSASLADRWREKAERIWVVGRS
jgi:hypothetical protein